MMTMTEFAEGTKASKPAQRCFLVQLLCGLLLNMMLFKIPPMCYSSPAPAPQRYSISRDLNS